MKFFACLILILLSCLMINKKSIAQKDLTSIYDYVGNFSEGLARVKKDGEWGFVNMQGEEVVLLEYSWVYGFFGELALVSKNGKWGFINRRGEKVISLEYDDAYRLSEGVARVKKDGRWEFLNTEAVCLY